MLKQHTWIASDLHVHMWIRMCVQEEEGKTDGEVRKERCKKMTAILAIKWDNAHQSLLSRVTATSTMRL